MARLARSEITIIDVRDGGDGEITSVGYEYSIDGLAAWHSEFVTGDHYRRERVEYFYTVADKVNNTPYLTTPWSSASQMVPRNGVDYGYKNSTVFLYQKISSQITAPPAPSGILNYNFNTLALTEVGAGALNGWSTTVPSGVDSMWIAVASIWTLEDNDDIAANEWVIELMAPKGVDGATGVYTSYIYINSTTVPADDVFAAGSYDGTTEVFPQVTAGVYYTDDPQTPAAGETTYIRIGKYKHTPATELVAESWNIHTVTYASGWSTATKFSSDTIYEIYEYSPDGIVGTGEDWNTDLRLTDFYRRTATVTNGVSTAWSTAVRIRIDGLNPAVTDNGDGTYTVVDGNGTSVTITDGENAAIPTVTDNGDGTSTINDGLGNTVVIADGDTPEYGFDYFDGSSGNYISYVYKNVSTGDAVPAEPTNGSFTGTSEVLPTIPTGWLDTFSPVDGTITYVSKNIYVETITPAVGTTAASKSWSNPAWSVAVPYIHIPVEGTDYFLKDGSFKSFIFRTAATVPTGTDLPVASGTGSGTFVNDVETPPTDWFDDPYFTAGQITWVCSGLYTQNATTKVWSLAAWSAPSEYSEKGDTGLDGDYTSYVYRNATAAPTDIDTDAAVTNKGTYSGTSEVPPTLWSDDPSTPTAPNVTWVSKARYYQDNDGTWLRANGWSTPTKFTGKDAWSTKTVILYKAGDTVSKPTSSSTYTFDTGTLSPNPLDTWSTSFPSNTTEGGKVWVTFNTALSQGNTDTLDAVNWSTPSVIAQNGVNGVGTNGLHGSGSYIYKTAPTFTIADFNAIFDGNANGTDSGTHSWLFLSIAGRLPQIRDVLSYVNDTATDPELRFREDLLFNGSGWDGFVDVVNGNQIVHGTVAAEHIKANTITGDKINAAMRMQVGDAADNYALVQGSSNGGVAFAAGMAAITDSGTSAPFKVGHDGALTATNANISGTISGSAISGSTISGGSISIGGGFSVTTGGQVSSNNASFRSILPDFLAALNAKSSATGDNTPMFSECLSTGSGFRGYSTSGKGIVALGATYDFYASGTGANYGPFTGSHDGLVPVSASELVTGDIVCDVNVVITKNISNAICEMEVSSTPNQRSARGIYVSRSALNPLALPAALDWTIEEHVLLSDVYDLIVFNGVGEGAMNVCGEAGDIEIGDLIVTSSLAGKGMKQSDDLVRNITVAEARQHVTFTSSTEVKQIAVIYRCG